jgi:hypothetical protein
MAHKTDSNRRLLHNGLPASLGGAPVALGGPPGTGPDGDAARPVGRHDDLNDNAGGWQALWIDLGGEG